MMGPKVSRRLREYGNTMDGVRGWVESARSYLKSGNLGSASLAVEVADQCVEGFMASLPREQQDKYAPLIEELEAMVFGARRLVNNKGVLSLI